MLSRPHPTPSPVCVGVWSRECGVWPRETASLQGLLASTQRSAGYSVRRDPVATEEKHSHTDFVNSAHSGTHLLLSLVGSCLLAYVIVS